MRDLLSSRVIWVLGVVIFGEKSSHTSTYDLKSEFSRVFRVAQMQHYAASSLFLRGFEDCFIFAWGHRTAI